MSKLSERMRDERCLRAGHNIQYFRSEENRIQNATFALDQQISDVQEEIDALEKEIQSIEAVQAAARAAGSATGNPALSAVSELGGQAFAYARQKDAKERQRDQLAAQVSRMRVETAKFRRQLDSVEQNLRHAHGTFEKLGCSLSHMPL